MSITETKVPAATGRQRIELGVIGMTCAACVRRVDKALRAVDGVRNVNVNLVTHRATVEVIGEQVVVIYHVLEGGRPGPARRV